MEQDGQNTPPPGATTTVAPVAPPAPAAASDLVDATSTPPPPAPVVTPPAKKNPWMIAIIAGLSVLVLSASSAAAYFAYVVPRKPENVMRAALSNFMQAKTARLDGSALYEDKQGAKTLEVTFGGNVAEDKFDLSAEVDALVTTIKVDLRSTDGKSLFVKVDGLEGLPDLLAASDDPTTAALAPVLDSVNGQWFEINESLIKQFGGDVKLNTWTAEDYAKIAIAYEQHPFLVVKQTLASEAVKGELCYHYRVGIDKKQLEDFATAVKNAKLQVVTITDDMLKSFNGMVGKMDFSKDTADVWITTGSKQFRQFAIAGKDGTGTASLRFTLTNYDKPFKVEKPKNAKSILQVLSSFLGTGDESTLPDSLMQQLENPSGEGVSL